MFRRDYPHQIVLAFVDGYRLQELRKTVESDCSIRFVTTAEKIGHETYKRSLCFLLVKAVHDIGGHENISGSGSISLWIKDIIALWTGRSARSAVPGQSGCQNARAFSGEDHDRKALDPYGRSSGTVSPTWNV